MNRRQYKKRYGKSYPSKRQLNFFLTNLGKAVADTVETIRNMVCDSFQVIKDFVDEIKTMPEEELQIFINEHPDLTLEQIALIHKLRGNSNDNDRT